MIHRKYYNWFFAALFVGLGTIYLLRGSEKSDDTLQNSAAKTDTHEQLYTCGMHPQVLQDHPGNCPICHMKLVPVRDSDSGRLGASADQSERKIKYYWDPMLGPSSISDKPGKSSMGMDLIPVYEDTEDAGPSVQIDPSVIQNVGIRTSNVVQAPLTIGIRAAGILTLPESGMHEVSSRLGGWIEKLYADKEGMHVKKGDPLFEIYSPDLQVAEEEYIGAIKSRNKNISTEGTFIESAKRKLELLGVSSSETDSLSKMEHAPKTTTIRSPITGHIEEKGIIEGGSVEAGMKLFKIADHSSLWLQIQIYSPQAPLISLGQQVEATIDAFPGKIFKGEVNFIYPHLDEMTRTLTARIVIPNTNFELKAGMYGTAVIRSEQKQAALQVPREAVIDTGEKQIVFVALSGGHFEPRLVQMGQMGVEGQVEILTGLQANETVVTSGQFLLDVESRTTEAIQKIRKQKDSPSSVANMEMMQ